MPSDPRLDLIARTQPGMQGPARDGDLERRLRGVEIPSGRAVAVRDDQLGEVAGQGDPITALQNVGPQVQLVIPDGGGIIEWWACTDLLIRNTGGTGRAFAANYVQILDPDGAQLVSTAGYDQVWSWGDSSVPFGSFETWDTLYSTPGSPDGTRSDGRSGFRVTPWLDRAGVYTLKLTGYSSQLNNDAFWRNRRLLARVV